MLGIYKKKYDKTTCPIEKQEMLTYKSILQNFLQRCVVLICH